MKRRAFLGLAAAVHLAILFAPGARGDEPAPPPAVDNGSLRIEFHRQGGGLVQVVDQLHGRPFLDGGAAADLWAVTLLDGAKVAPSAAGEFSWQAADGGRGIALRWSKFAAAVPPELAVIVRVELDEREPTASWDIELTGIGAAAVRTVAGPRVGPLARREGETLAVPQWMGEATGQARTLLNPGAGKAARWAWDYPGILSMQFLAWYAGDGGGLLFSADDDKLLRKQFAVAGDGGGGVTLEAVHELPVGSSAGEFKLPYRVRLQLFHGDWFTAAELYRQWAGGQWWVRESRLKTGQTPEWLRTTPLWVWNRGRSDGVLRPAARLAHEAGFPVSVFWHWWHGCAYDVNFPEYFPPRDGTERFQQAVAEARESGIHAIVYMNQRLWGMTAASWESEGAAALAVKDPSGRIAPEVYNTFVKAPCASMCMGTQGWRDKYAGLAERALGELGVSGVYMDQACSSLGCYDPSHGHPLGGGGYWMEGFQRLSAEIRRRADRPVTLAGEGCGEGWLPYLDAMLSLQVSLERYLAREAWTPAPLFNAVYHDAAIQFGNYASLTRPPYDELWPRELAPAAPLELLDRKFATQFYLEQARSFAWGQQPTLANFTEEQLSERREEIEYVLNLARLRARGLKYLRDGVMLRPPSTDAGDMEIAMSRLSIYAGQLDAVKERTGRAPRVLTSAWRAPDGDVAVVLANIMDEPVTTTVQLNLPPATGGAARRVRRIETAAAGTGEPRLAEELDPAAAAWQVELGPREVRVYEIVASGE